MNFISKLLTLILVTSLFGLSCKTESGDHTESQTEKVDYKHNDNTVRMRLPADLRNLNPAYMRGYEPFVLEYIFPFMMSFNPKTQEFVNVLLKFDPVIEEITDGENAGGQAITFELLDEAVWDDGKPVTGDDYTFTMKTFFNPKVPSAHIATFLEHVKDVIVDENNPKKFTVLTKRKYILSMPTVANLPILPKHIYDPTNLMGDISLSDLTNPNKAEKLVKNNSKLDEFATQITSPKYSVETVVGCGAYKLVEKTDKQSITLAKKQNWWGDKLARKNYMLQAHPDTIKFVVITDDNAVIAAIKDEAIDAAFSINSNLFEDLKESEAVVARYNFSSPNTYNFFYTILNTKNPKLADKRVRRALAHLLDINKLVEVVYAGYGEALALPFPKNQPYFRNDLKPIPYDLTKASRLLDEAGWNDSDSDGIRDKMIDGEKVKLILNFLGTGTLFSDNYLSILKDNGKKIGVGIEGEVVSFASMIRERLPARDFELASLQGAADPLSTSDPKQLWHTSSDTPSGSNRSGFGTPATDALIDSIRITMDEEVRYEMYRRLQGIIYEEQPWLMLFTPTERVVIHKRFEGETSVIKPAIHATHLKLKK